MILWLNPFSGISGDMLLGALLDLGAPLDNVRAAIASTEVAGWELTADPVLRCGVRACHASVRVTGAAPERKADELIALAGAARPEPVAKLAVAALTALAEAEGQVHGVPAEQVHLHELGGVDTLVDTVGVAAAVYALGVTAVWSAPLALGSGSVTMAHGRYPAPAPGTLALLAGADVTGLGPAGETVTPTGAALLRALGCRYGPLPVMRLAASGHGAGSRDVPDQANVLPALLGEPAVTAAGGRVETLIVVETTLDDVTGELLGELPGLLLQAGATDAWITPVTGKKGRPAHVVTALCPPGDAGDVEARLLAETGSLGARQHPVQRRALPRTAGEVFVDGHRIRVKIGPHRAKPEHADVTAAAQATGRPQRVIAEQAIAQLHAF
ncbi:MAG: nickel pincer cofactor biosynthesis protein LarC [Streptosporangiaceae bacterium]